MAEKFGCGLGIVEPAKGNVLAGKGGGRQCGSKGKEARPISRLKTTLENGEYEGKLSVQRAPPGVPSAPY